MQGTRHYLLAGAGFAEDQHIGLGSGQCADLLAQAQHRPGLTEQACRQLLAVGQGQAQRAVVQHQLAQRQGTPHAVKQRLAGEGLFQEIVGTGAHGLHRQLDVTVPGDEDHRQLVVACAQLLQQLQPVDPRHADVTDHHPLPVRRQACSQAASIAQADHLEPGQVEGLAQRLAQMRIVVDQHHLGLGTDRGVAAHWRWSSLGKATPGSALRRNRPSCAPPSGWLLMRSSPPRARIRVSQIARPRPRP